MTTQQDKPNIATAALALIERIERKRQEQALLLAKLRWHVLLAQQGIDAALVVGWVPLHDLRDVAAPDRLRAVAVGLRLIACQVVVQDTDGERRRIDLNPLLVRPAAAAMLDGDSTTFNRVVPAPRIVCGG